MNPLSPDPQPAEPDVRDGDRQAKQQAEQAKTALDNVREGYGHPPSLGVDTPDKPEGDSKVYPP